MEPASHGALPSLDGDDRYVGMEDMLMQFCLIDMNSIYFFPFLYLLFFFVVRMLVFDVSWAVISNCKLRKFLSDVGWCLSVAVSIIHNFIKLTIFHKNGELGIFACMASDDVCIWRPDVFCVDSSTPI